MVIPCNLIRLIEIHNTIRIRLYRHTTVRNAAYRAARDRLTSDVSVAATVYSYWSIGKINHVNHCPSQPRPSVTITFHRLTLKLVCESHLRWETFLPTLGTLCLYVLEELFAIYATDRQTDGRTKATLIIPFPIVGGIIITLG